MESVRLKKSSSAKKIIGSIGFQLDISRGRITDFPDQPIIFLRIRRNFPTSRYVRRVELVKRERTVYRRRRRRKRASIEKIRRSVPPLLRPISLLLSPWRARGQRKQQHRSNNRQTRLVESFAPIALPYLH